MTVDIDCNIECETCGWYGNSDSATLEEFFDGNMLTVVYHCPVCDSTDVIEHEIIAQEVAHVADEHVEKEPQLV